VLNFIVAKSGIFIKFIRVTVECRVTLVFGSLPLLQEAVSSYAILYLMFIPVFYANPDGDSEIEKMQKLLEYQAAEIKQKDAENLNLKFEGVKIEIRTSTEGLKKDIDALKKDLDTGTKGLKEDLDTSTEGLKKDIDALKKDIDTSTEGLKKDIDTSTEGLKKEIDALKKDLDTSTEGLKKDIDALKKHIDTSTEGLKKDIDTFPDIYLENDYKT
jgi:archaellum component FlaC